jgi:hypothetical protein
MPSEGFTCLHARGSKEHESLGELVATSRNLSEIQRILPNFVMMFYIKDRTPG